MAKVEVRPIEKKKWHNKTGSDIFSQPKIIEALIDGDTRLYRTGLTEEEEIEYSKKLGVNLSNRPGNNPDKIDYWQEKAAWISLPYRTTIFDTSKPEDYVKVKVLKDSKFVANSQKEEEQGLFPEATHIIYDEEEQIDNRATKVEEKQKAFANLSKMSLEDKQNVLHILSGKSTKGKSSNFVNVKLEEEIEASASKFNSTFDLGRESVSIRAKVLELLANNILTKDAGGIFYLGELVAINYEDAVAWFANPNNQTLKVKILETLETKHR